jgi:hypothetical protein
VKRPFGQIETGPSTPRERMLDREFDGVIAKIKATADAMDDDEFCDQLRRIQTRCTEMLQHHWMRK